MKTEQDWSFITREAPLSKPAMKENKMFHALTAANAKNRELEVYAATENILRREKELCQMALGDLQKLDGKEENGTLKMLLDHYRSRMEVTAEKEGGLKRLSEDSKKLNEEYRKKNQELAEVKRNLMESQSKLREMAKVTDKLTKKEEELRFIEEQLRGELETNRRGMLNGLYEVVAELSERGGEEDANPLGSKSAFLERFQSEENKPVDPIPVSFPLPADSGNRTLVDIPPAPAAPPEGKRLPQLLERSARLQALEPAKEDCSKSLVKSPEGVLLCEYFFPTQAPRDARHYVFNTAYTVRFLLETLAVDLPAFPKNLELAFGDLSSRLAHSQNIHLEAACKDLLNRDALVRLLALGLTEKPAAFLDLAEKCLQRFEALGPKRVELIRHQFGALPA